MHPGAAGWNLMDSSSPRFGLIQTAPYWRRVDFMSDLHLQADPPATFELWQSYMRDSHADALFILGDLFEVWIGDDVLPAANGESGGSSAFERRCRDVLRDTTRRLPVFFMHGNRDFLLGPRFLADCGVFGLQDPSLFEFQSRRYLLTHGDALCLDDDAYQAFRAMVRTEEWQTDFLARPLSERRVIARRLREQSTERQKTLEVQAEVDANLARAWLQQAQASIMIHGHTHRPAEHDLGQGLQRIVLSDWDGSAQPPRAQLLRLDPSGWQRLDLSQALASRRS